ncbi:MAG: translation elongation factor 4, partial [Patescibacteria group bacterium]
MVQTENIRNFSIIAHIDHGKSTLADRMLEMTGTISKREMREQVLDQMELEREKGITIKLQPVRMEWPFDSAQGKKTFVLNLIDTPGHVDFQYEVSRSLQAVEGAILLVDATQGVQAQTLANLYLALEQNLAVIPVINKIDLPAADVEGVTQEFVNLLGVSENEILKISAKTGEGVREVLDAVVAGVKPPLSRMSEGLRALIFDSIYDDYKGVVAYVRVMEGNVARGDTVRFLSTDASDRVVEVGFFKPQLMASEGIGPGEIGYVATGLKDIRQARVGDTIASDVKAEPLAGFTIPQPKVFAGIYPAQGDDFHLLREAIAKLQLNDASLAAQQERSQALGQGFRCGFLGMLHLEIIQERLKREHNLDVVVTTPSVMYRVKVRGGEIILVKTPDQFPDAGLIEQVEDQLARV